MEDDVLVRPDRVRVLVALRHAVVEQLKEVNLFRGLVEGGEELVAEVEGLPVEELLVEHGQLLRPELLRAPVSGSHPVMSILRGTAYPRKMLQACCHFLFLQAHHHGGHKPRHHPGIRPVGALFHNTVLHIRQIRHRRKVKVEPQA